MLGFELDDRRRRPRRGAALRPGFVLALCLLAALSSNRALAQFGMDDWPGTKPTKAVGGGDVAWNGVEWVVPPGGVIEWTIRITNDHFDPAVLIGIQDDIPDQNDGDPMLPFDPAVDVLADPGGTLSYSGDWLSVEDAPLYFGETTELRWQQTVDPAATPGAELCNLAFIGYLEADGSGDPVMSIPLRWRHRTVPEGEDTVAPVCVTVAGPEPNLAESWKEAADEDGDGVVQPGETVTYTLTIRNTGSGPAREVVVTDVLPPGLVPVSATEGGVIAGDTVTWDMNATVLLERVRTVDTVVLELTAAWEGCLPDGELLCNQATITSPDLPGEAQTGDPNLGPGTPTCLPVASPALSDSPLSVSDAGGDGEYAGGELVTWQLEVVNSGSADAVDVVVELPIEPWIMGVTPLDGGTFAAGTVTWDSAGTPALALIPPGGGVMLSVEGAIDPRTADGDDICAQAAMTPSGCAAELSAAAGDPVVPGPTCFLVVGQAEIVLSLTATDASGDGVLELGELLELEVRVDHVAGGTATDVEVLVNAQSLGLLDSLEADEGGVAGTDDWSWTPAGTPELASIAPGGGVVLHARGRLTCAAGDGTGVCATGEASGTNTGAPAGAGPSCVTAARAVLGGSPLSASDGDGDGIFELGETIRIDLSVTNSGSAPARDVQVTLPLRVEDLMPMPSDGGMVLADRIEWTPATTPGLTSIAAGASVPLSVDLQIDPAASAGRACRQAELLLTIDPSCEVELSDDASVPNAADPTCYDIGGDADPPGEVPDGDPLSGGPIPVRLVCQGADLYFEWDAAPRALTHHVYRGPLDSFASRPWTNPASAIDDPENSEVSCDLARLDYLDEGGCEPGGESFYFLVIGRNLIGDGPVGEQLRSGVFEPRTPVSNPCP